MFVRNRLVCIGCNFASFRSFNAFDADLTLFSSVAFRENVIITQNNCSIDKTAVVLCYVVRFNANVLWNLHFLSSYRAI